MFNQAEVTIVFVLKPTTMKVGHCYPHHLDDLLEDVSVSKTRAKTGMLARHSRGVILGD